MAAAFAVVAYQVSLSSYERAVEVASAETASHAWHQDPATVHTYSQVKVSLVRQPQALGVLAGDRTHGLMSSALISGRYGPTVLEDKSKDSVFLSAVELDFCFFLGLLVSLLGVLLTYDAVAGEHESGVLRLVACQPLTRRHLLLGEFLAGLVSLLLVTAVCFGVVAVLAGRERSLGFESGDWIGYLAIAGLTLATGAVFLSLGLLVSSTTQRRVGALSIAFVAWLTLVVLWPQSAGWLARVSQPVSPMAVMGDAAPTPRFLISINPLRAERSDAARQREVINGMLRRLEMENEMSRWSPFGSYLAATRLVAASDVGSGRRFLQQVWSTERLLRAWQDERVARHPHRERTWTPDDGPLDLSGLPRPSYRPEAMGVRLVLSMPAVLLLCAEAGILLLLAYRRLSFRLQERPRSLLVAGRSEG